MVCDGPVIRVWMNHEPVSVIANAQALTGRVGLEAEGRPFEVRTFRIRLLPARQD